MNPRDSKGSRWQTSQFTATFDAKTMVEVPKKQKPSKRQSKAKSQAIWQNRNMACDLHKKRKKECDPQKCVMNKNFHQPPKIEPFCNAQSEESTSNDADREPQSNEAVHEGLRNEINSRDLQSEAEGPMKDVFSDDRAASLAGDYSVDGEGACQFSQELIPYENDQGTWHISTGEERNIEDIVPHDAMSTGQQGGQFIWPARTNSYGRGIPRSLPCVFHQAICGPVPDDETEQDFPNLDAEYMLSSSPLSHPALGEGIKQNSPALSWKNDKDDGNGGGDGNGKDRSWNPHEYGDYWDSYDTFGQDCSGYFGDSSNSGTGGGYSKPGGGYYSLSLNSLGEGKFGIEGAASDGKVNTRVLCSVGELEEGMINFSI